MERGVGEQDEHHELRPAAPQRADRLEIGGAGEREDDRPKTRPFRPAEDVLGLFGGESGVEERRHQASAVQGNGVRHGNGNGNGHAASSKPAPRPGIYRTELSCSTRTAGARPCRDAARQEQSSSCWLGLL